MKLMTLNVNKFNYDVSKRQALSYINAVGADLTVLQEYTQKVAIKHLMLCKPQHFTDKRCTFTAAISGCYHITGGNSKQILLTPASNYAYPSVLGVHITDENFPKFRADGVHITDENFPEFRAVIVCGDFNRGYPHNKPDMHGERFYQSLLKKDYTDLWAWGIKLRRAFYTDCFGTEHAAEENAFYRTFNTQRVNDYILCRKDFVSHLTKVLIDYRTLTFTDHCAVIAEFDIF